ncbi:MAG: hypothetical protein J0I48_13755 [Devosia sp.]|uniref:hypothetical protein n=1 Tax=Devosia sp. 66-22 TaxID=1895753 RepID=UPI00092AE1C7|nr:hypothetical protein [Devosia sp. 66-22]MBN9347244.1 hypothetical protein [Devosia sp.]OJX50657.1 MAG: hypothetical protein BGO81_20630 [Devosia sp. 66-22]
MRKPLIALSAVVLLACPVQAGQPGEIATDALYAGKLAEGIARLEPLAAADDPGAWFGIGAIRLTQAIEHLSQALYRHGFAVDAAPNAFGMGIVLPIPQNPNPEPLDYAGVRAILGDFVLGLDEARAAFETAAESGDYVIELNPLKIRVDANGDGTVEEAESLAGLLAMWNGVAADDLLAPSQPGEPSSFEYIGFDRADGFWLAGYTQVLASQADFLLAHDFSAFTDATFHRLFPRAGFPMQEFATGGMLMLDPQTDTGIADAIAGIHTLDWPVIEPERLKGVRERMLAVLDYSRQNWAAIIEETDNNHELLPSPKQTSLFPDAAVDEARVAAWLVTLDKARDVLDGQLLIPHWRFSQGFDLKAYFETAKETDLVMILTGAGALPFLGAGKVATPEDFRAIQDAFGSDWLGYAFWFN